MIKTKVRMTWLTCMVAAFAAPALAQNANDSDAGKKPVVQVVKPARGSISLPVQVPATVEAVEHAQLYSRQAGYVSAIRADIGDTVNATDVLAVLDVPELAAELAEAKAVHSAKAQMLIASDATIAQARSAMETARQQFVRYQTDLALQEITLKRQEDLFKEKATTAQQLDEMRSKAKVAQADAGVASAKVAGAEADVKAAEAGKNVAAAQVAVAAAQVEKVNTLIGYTRIVAPFAGTITQRSIDRGDLVQAASGARGLPLFTIQRADEVRVCCDLPEASVMHIRKDDPAIIKPLGQDDRSFESKVSRLSKSLNPATRTMRVEVQVANPDGRLVPGMYAKVTLDLARRKDVLLAPASAVVTEGAQKFVLAVRDGKIERTPIKIGIDNGTQVEIVEGISPEMEIVAAAKSAPAPGTPVTVAKAP